MSEWRGIESAPKDGYFLVYGGKWVGEITSSSHNVGIVAVSRMGNLFAVAFAEYYWPYIEDPTHWMPLPQPPKEGD